MPPPRLIRPLRPWQPPRIPSQLRWTSDGPRDKLKGRGHDSAPGRDEPAAESTDTDGERARPQETRAAGCWGRLMERISTKLSKPPPPPSISSECRTMPPVEHQAQSHVHHSSAPPLSEPATELEHEHHRPPWSETTCHVCQQTFKNRRRLRRHILDQNDVSCWSAGFASREEALRYQKFRESVGTHDWPGALHMTKKTEQGRICGTCEAPVRGHTAHVKHLLESEPCWVEAPGNSYLFACRWCSETFTSITQARLHCQSSPRCVHFMAIRTIVMRRLAKRYRRTINLVEKGYLQSIKYLIEIRDSLSALPSPLASSPRTSIDSYLLLIYRRAQQTRDNDILALLDKHRPSTVALSRKTISKQTQEKPALKDKETAQPKETHISTESQPVQVHERSIVKDSQLMRAQERSMLKHNRPKQAQNKPAGRAVKSTPAENQGFRQRTQVNEKPPVSSVESHPDSLELKVQLQQLIDQVKILQERIEASSSSMMQTPVQEIPTGLESLSTTSGQHLEDASASLDSPPANESPKADQNKRDEPIKNASLSNERVVKEAENNADGQRLTRQVHAQARLMKSSGPLSRETDAAKPETPRSHAASEPTTTSSPSATSEMREQSLLNELFPEASSYIQPYDNRRDQYPKLSPPMATLSPPMATPPIRQSHPKDRIANRERYIEAFQKKSEKVTVLQLLNCSTELTEADFRRLVPRGKHIGSWARNGEFDKVIPGRDPLSLERLPFYYLLFKSPDAAFRYQNNAARLHKLSKLHQPNSALSAIPPPRGFLEDGEDINAATSSYLLKSTDQDLSLNMLMQPYNRALSSLLAQGGYKPIVPTTTPSGTRIHKVLFYIEGYEPSAYDIFQLFLQDASKRGLSWPFLAEHQSIHRLRDVIDLKAKLLPVSTANPRAANTAEQNFADMYTYDPSVSFFGKGDRNKEDDGGEGLDARVINQIIMNKVYNRWIIEFSEEEGARRFARLWHRKVLPAQQSSFHRTWRDVEEVRMCNAEYLW